MTRCRARLLTLLAALAIPWLLGVAGAYAAAWTVPLATGSAGEARSQALPAAPGGLAAACRSSTSSKVQLSWTGVLHASSYTVYVSTTSATSGFAVKAAGVTGTAWTSGNLATGTYWWQVCVTIGTAWTSPASASSGSTTIHATGTTCTTP